MNKSIYWNYPTSCLLYFLYLFYFFSAGEVSIAEHQTLDFESELHEYILTVVVNDGTIDSEPVNLTLQITDVNERPVFSQSVYYVETIEMKVSNFGGKGNAS